MAQKKKTVKKRKPTRKSVIKKGLSFVFVIMLLIAGYFAANKVIKNDNNQNYELPGGVAQFHFIDVGQGDAELIMVGDKNILIDTGDRGGKDALVKYLKDHNVTEIEYFIVTHPDADHFASAAYVLDNYTVKNVIMSNAEKTTQMFETFIATLEKHTEINVINAHDEIGTKYDVNGLELKILAPLSESYTDTNDYSVVVMARYGNKKFLLTGDAEKKSEAEMVEIYSASDLKCDVLKVGHHGSRTSTSDAFLRMANPTYAVISCGKDNKFDHPHTETLNRLNDAGITIYRTDELGSIVLETDGDKITKK